MIILPDIELTALIDSTAEQQCYRGRRTSDGQAIIVCVLDEQASPSAVRRIQHAYDMQDFLEGDWALEPLELLQGGGYTVLIVLDPGVAPLQTAAPVAGSQGLLHSTEGLIAYLKVAISAVEAVAAAHAKGIIHKAIQPRNIWLQGATGQARLGGFDTATLAPREHEAPQPLEILVGALAYMAPEQTGRMNRSVDSRSDLYALGVTLYAMFTGVLPFQAASTMEWVHCHIARQPVPAHLRSPGLPEELSNIIMKLLAKSAEDRYQTANGLKTDLQRCLADLQRDGHIAPFALAQRDALGRLSTPEKLYGRALESQALLNAFERVVQTGQNRMVLVSGYSGSGKSSLVAELHRAMVQAPGLYLAGKCDQYKRDIPYATLAQAFDTFFRELLLRNDAEINRWRTALMQTLGTSSKLLSDVIPALQHLIDPQPEPPPLMAHEAQSRFHAVFGQFLGLFANANQALVLFLDDLQWLDAASLKLLDYLLASPDVNNLLLVGAFRDNEVGQVHPLMHMVASLRDGGTPIDTLVLAPLGPQELLCLVADTLRCTQDYATPLAALIHDKTAGNPFFAIQFLGALAQEQLLVFDATADRWEWDVGRILAKDITDNVVELMVGKLQRLNALTQHALQYLACLGNRASMALLMAATDNTAESVTAGLIEAVRTGLVMQNSDGYRFQHDRVQEAAYALIPEANRPAMHRSLGQRLHAHLAAHGAAAEVDDFDVVNHLNRGPALLLDGAERTQLLQLNVQVGQRAKAAGSYAAARNYLSQALALMPADAWEQNYLASFELHLQLAECEYLVGAFDKSDALFNQTLHHASSRLDQVRVYNLLVPLYQVAGRYEDAVAAGLKGLAVMGITVPTLGTELKQATAAEFALARANMEGRTVQSLLEAPLVTDPEAQALIRILVATMPANYFAGSAQGALLIAMSFNLSLRFGNMPETCYIYGAFAPYALHQPGNAQSSLELSELSLTLNERFGNAKLRGVLQYMHSAFVNSWFRPVSSTTKLFQTAWVNCVEVGEVLFANYAALLLLQSHLESGVPLPDVAAAAHKSHAFEVHSKNHILAAVTRLYAQFALCLEGHTTGVTQFDSKDFNEDQCVQLLSGAGNLTGVALYHLLKLMAAYTHQRFDVALEAANRGSKFLLAVGGSCAEATFHFYRALALIASWPDQSAAEQKDSRQVLDRIAARYQQWAIHSPKNYQSRYAMLSAELARLDGNQLLAMRWYEDAITSATENHLQHHEALAHELAAGFYTQAGFPNAAVSHWRGARQAYARWGALAKVRMIDRNHPELQLKLQMDASAPAPADESLANMDLETVVRASQAVSGEIELDQLVQTLLSVAIEHAGATRGLLIEVRGSVPVVTATGEVQSNAIAVTLHHTADAYHDLPYTLLHDVVRTHAPVLLDDATVGNPYSGDAYLQQHSPKSLLCVPLLKQTTLVGVLYLENRLAAGAFTPGRVAVLELLASQAAISLENATLYQEVKVQEARMRELNDSLEQRVTQRTAELSAAIQRLTSTQEELVQAEKLASLGAMVAGISHELNTPIGIVVTISSTMADSTKGIQKLIAEGALKRSELADFLEKKHEMENLVLRSVTRAAGLISSFKQVAADRASEQRRVFDLKTVIEDIAASLRPGMKDQPWQLRLDVPDAIMCDSFPGPLGQIVTNLVQNASIHAFGGRTQGSISIQATQTCDEIILTVRDDGIGMDAHTAKHAFDPFFTTRMGRGSGLGLSIAHRIATATLGGSLVLETTPNAGACFTLRFPCTALGQGPNL